MEHSKRTVLNAFSRAKQMVDESIGSAEKTEFGQEFDRLSEMVDLAKIQIEQTIEHISHYINPSSGHVLLTTLAKTMSLSSKGGKARVTPEEVLALHLQECALQYPDTSTYAQALHTCGNIQRQLGEAWTVLQAEVGLKVQKPLEILLKESIKSVLNERKRLSSTRLDLDAAKARVHNAKTAEKSGNAQIDKERLAREFESQFTTTKLLMQEVVRRNEEGVHRLIALADAQHRYYSNCAALTNTLRQDLRRIAGLPKADDQLHQQHSQDPVPPSRQKQQPHPKPTTPRSRHTSKSSFTDVALAEPCMVTANGDYFATSKEELSVYTGDELELLYVDDKGEYSMCTKDGQRGLVPITCLNINTDDEESS